MYLKNILIFRGCVHIVLDEIIYKCKCLIYSFANALFLMLLHILHTCGMSHNEALLASYRLTDALAVADSGASNNIPWPEMTSNWNAF